MQDLGVPMALTASCPSIQLQISDWRLTPLQY